MIASAYRAPEVECIGLTHSFQLRYEDLVKDQRKFMTEAADFIGVPFADSMLYSSRSERP